MVDEDPRWFPSIFRFIGPDRLNVVTTGELGELGFAVHQNRTAMIRKK
jgi:hypothetical protein